MYVTVFDNCLFSVEISIDIGFKVSVNYNLEYVFIVNSKFEIL